MTKDDVAPGRIGAFVSQSKSASLTLMITGYILQADGFQPTMAVTLLTSGAIASLLCLGQWLRSSRPVYRALQAPARIPVRVSCACCRTTGSLICAVSGALPPPLLQASVVAAVVQNAKWNEESQWLPTLDFRTCRLWR